MFALLSILIKIKLDISTTNYYLLVSDISKIKHVCIVTLLCHLLLKID